MNFVKLYIGDYLRDTGTLTLAQHGAYALMLLEHYATEKPLPTGRELHRLLRSDSKAEREAIDFVAGKYWHQVDGGLSNTRALHEIERASNQRAINQEIGKRGGRPKKTERVIESQANRNPNQTPDTRHQEIQDPPPPTVATPPVDSPTVSKKPTQALPTPDDVPDQVWVDWLALRRSKRAAVTPTVIDAARREASKAGMSLDDFLRVWCLRGSQSLQANWLKPDEFRGAHQPTRGELRMIEACPSLAAPHLRHLVATPITEDKDVAIGVG